MCHFKNYSSSGYLSLLVHLVDCPEFVYLGRINHVVFARTCTGIRIIMGLPLEVVLINSTNFEGSMQIDQLFAEEISNHAEITRRDALNTYISCNAALHNLIIYTHQKLYFLIQNSVSLC